MIYINDHWKHNLDADLEEQINPHYRPSYKTMWEDQKKNNRILIGGMISAIVFSFVLNAGAFKRNAELAKELVAQKEQTAIGLKISSNYADLEKDLRSQLASCSAKLPKQKQMVGKVSYYSKDGCLGCGVNQITASGDKFDENKLTLALPLSMRGKISMGQNVLVQNIDNGKSVWAKFNDYGGFQKYGRIADLSKATCEAIDCKTDISKISIIYY